MKIPIALCLLTTLLHAGPPLSVVHVVREGLPPYEDEERRYRLEGEGCEQLAVGSVVVLVRPGERRSPGQLEVVAVDRTGAMGRILKPGASFPMKGDLAIPRERLATLPRLPASPQPLAAPWARRPPASPAATPPPPGAAHREPIFFLPEDATLTPGAKAKLKAWVLGWGRNGHWLLALPPAPPSPLTEARVTALREELGRLGVSRVELGTVDQEPAGRFAAVFVVLNPC